MPGFGQRIPSAETDTITMLLSRVVLPLRPRQENEVAPNASTTTTLLANPNEMDATDYGPQLNFTIWLMTALALTILVLRVYCKTSRHRRLWWDDYVLIVAWFSLAIAATMTSVSVGFGYGRHIENIPQSDLDMLPRVANVAGFFSILAALWSKTSFAITLSRISDGWIFRFIWIIIVSMNLVMGTSAVLIWIQVPMAARIMFYIFSTAYSGAMDITLSIFPWKIIWNLTMTRKEKIGVLIAMSMGVFAGATSIVKTTKIPSLNSEDPADSVQLVIFGIAESAITIIAASIPVLRALIRENQPHAPPADFNEMHSLQPLRKTTSAKSLLEN